MQPRSGHLIRIGPAKKAVVDLTTLSDVKIDRYQGNAQPRKVFLASITSALFPDGLLREPLEASR